MRFLFTILVLIFSAKLFAMDNINAKNYYLCLSYSMTNGKIEMQPMGIGRAKTNAMPLAFLFGVGWYEYLTKEKDNYIFISEENGKELERKVDDSGIEKGIFYNIFQKSMAGVYIFGQKLEKPYHMPLTEELELLPEFYRVDYADLFKSCDKLQPFQVITNKLNFIGLRTFAYDKVITWFEGDKLRFIQLYNGVKPVSNFVVINP
jgi:hypothetical protein